MLPQLKMNPLCELDLQAYYYYKIKKNVAYRACRVMVVDLANEGYKSSEMAELCIFTVPVA